MSKIKKFLAVRYFLVPTDTMFQSTRTKEENNEIFLHAFMHNQDFRSDRGIELAIRGVDHYPDQKAYIAKLARKKTLKKQEKTDEDIEDRRDETWPFAYLVVYPGGQLMLVEQKSELNIDINALCDILGKHLTRSLQYQYGLIVSFRTINRKHQFWKFVENSQGVYYVKFSLDSPNLFGSQQEATETLRTIKALYHNTHFGFELENESAGLTLPREDFEPLVEYADEGGGQWVLQFEKDGRKVTKKSSDTVISTQAKIDEDEDEVSALFDILHRALEKVRTYESDGQG